MKTVLHLCEGIDSKRGGGIKSFLVDLLNNSNKNYTNYVVIFSCFEKDFSFLDLTDEVKVFSFNFSLRKERGTIGIRKLYKLLKDVDVIHQHSMWRQPSVISIFCSLFLSKKVIFQPHGSLITNALRKNYYFKLIFFYAIEQFNIRYCDILLVNSILEKNELIKFLKNRKAIEKILFVPLGVKSDFMLTSEKEQLNLNSKYEQKKVIAFFSRLHEGKGIELLLKTFETFIKNNKDVVLKIGGTGDNEYELKLKKIVSEHKDLKNRVFFLGYLDELGKKQLLDEAYVFVLPSFNESFSIAIAEALSRGVPVLTSKYTPWLDIHKSCGLISELDEFSLINSLNFISCEISKDEYLKYCNNAINLISKDFLFENNIKILEKEYLAND